MVSKAQLRAQKKYDKAHTRSILLKLNQTSDADILAKLDDVGNRQGYVKRLIRQDIRGNSDVLPVDALRYLVYPIARKNELRSVYLFGSYARGEATGESDVDLMLDGEITSMAHFLSVQTDLEKAFGKKVDLVMADAAGKNDTRAGRRFMSHFERDKVLLYESVQ